MKALKSSPENAEAVRSSIYPAEVWFPMKHSSLRVFLIITGVFLLSACGFVNGDILFLGQELNELPLPSKGRLELTLSLHNPTFDIYDLNQPTVKISGTTSRGQVKLFKDSECLSEIANGTASGSEFLATAAPLTDGVYSLNARAQDATGSWSSCFVMSGTYTLDTQPPILQAITPATVPTSGAQVSISGNHFNAGMSITIGGQACGNLIFLNSTQILCRAPRSALGSYDLLVTKPNGTSTNAVAAVSYWDPLPQAPLCFSNQVGLIKPLDTEIFVSGSFISVGTCAGSAVPVDFAGGVVSKPLSEFPQFAGDISTVISDGSGGFFIGGSFSNAGSYSRTNMVRINSNLGVDPQFNSTPNPLIVGDNLDPYYPSQVTGIIKDSSELIVFGLRTQAKNRIPSKLTSFNAVTGSLSPHQIEINGGYGIVNKIISDSQGGYFIGGDFTWVNGLPIKNLAHLTASGAVDLLFMPNPDDKVTGLALNGNILYVGGYFGYVFDQPHRGVMGIDLTNGTALNWTLRVGYVDQLAFYGSTIYILGIFTGVWTQAQGNLARSGTAAIDVTTGEPTAWTLNNWGSKVVIPAADGIYLGGSYTTISGTTVNTGLALVNPTSGALINTWGNLVPSGVTSMVLSGTTMYLAGTFTSIAGQTRNHLAAVDIQSGTLTAWNPDAGATGSVSNLSLWNNNIYAQGSFSQIGSSPKKSYAKIDVNTGVANDWDLPLDGWAGAPIYADSDKVFLGTSYRQSGPKDTGMITRVDTATGQQLSWRLQADGPIYTAILIGSKIFLGGSFSLIDGQSRSNFAVINKDTGQLAAWSPSFSGPVQQLEVLGSKLAVRGDFKFVDGQSRNYLAALDINLEQLAPWNPDLNYRADSMSSNGLDTVWIGGFFSTIGGQSRSNFAAIDFNTGLPSSLSLAFAGDFPNHPTFLKYQNSKLYLSGNFTQINGQARSFFAALDPTTKSLTTDTLSLGGPLKGLAFSGSQAYAIGAKSFSINNHPRSGSALVDKTTGNLKAWTALFERSTGGYIATTVSTVTYNSTTLYIGGSFAFTNGQVRGGLAAFNRSDGSFPSWNPDARSAVYTIELDGNTFYVGGNFSKINNVNRTRIGSVDATTGALLPWSPSSPGCVSKFFKSGRLLYTVGCFDTFFGLARPYLAAIDLDLGTLTGWTPSPGYASWDIDLCNDTVYVMGDYRRLGGQGRRRYGAVSTITGLATPFAPEPDNSPKMKCVGSKIYMAGASFVGGKRVSALSQLDPNTGLAEAWHPESSSNTSASVLASENDILYIGGTISNLSGYPRGGFIKLRTSDNSVADPW